MGDISQHFSRSEHACKCGCFFNAVDIVLNKELEIFRLHLNVYYPDAQIIIDSGNRCAKHDVVSGGRGKSFHLRGLAVDFRVTYIMDKKRVPLNTLVVEKMFNTVFPVSYGLITHKNFSHMDVRPRKFRDNQISKDEENEKQSSIARGTQT